MTTIYPHSIHGRGLVGHVEEISVAKEHQGKGLGLKMIQALDGVGKNLGCYKNILNCGAQNEPFYVRSKNPTRPPPPLLLPPPPIPFPRAAITALTTVEDH